MFTSKRNLLSAAVAGACAAMSMPGWAQATSAADQPAVAEVQTVVVSGFRSSLEKALDLKRAAIGQRDSIVAEDMGKFPEQNVADALVRLPGVEVVKDGASNEGQRIQLRGLGSEYTVTTFNGAPVRATSAGAIGSSTRDFNYDVFPSELFGRVDVYKTPLAELEEGGVAGLVDLQTPRPFDKAGRVIRYSVTGTYNTRSKDSTPRANVLYSNTWGKWGFLTSIAGNQTHNANAGFSSTGTYASYNQRFTQGNFQYGWNLTDPRAKLGNISAAQLYDANMPRFLRLTGTDNERDRIGVANSLQYKGDNLEVSWDSLFSKLQDDTKNNYLNFITNGSTGARALVPIDVSVDANNNVQGTIGNYTIGTNAVLGLSETRFLYNAINAKYRVTNDLRFTGSLAVNESKAWRSGATVSLDATDPAYRHTITFNTTNDAMFPSIATDRNLLDPQIYSAMTYSGNYQTETDKQKTVRLGMQYDYSFWNVEARLKMGLSNVESTKIANQYLPGNLLNARTLPDGRVYGALPNTPAGNAERIAYARQFITPNDLTKIKISDNVPQDWLTVNRDFVYDTLNALDANRAAPANLGGTFTAVETVRAFYVQSDFEKEVFGRPLRANAGVRYVKTDSDVDNYRLIQGGHAPNQLSGGYSNVLPSASLSYDLTSDLVLRGSVGKTIKRSSISAIARSINVPNGGDLVVQIGNPDLRPESSTNLDASLEWYFDKGGVLALSAYRKNIKDRPVSTSVFSPFNTLGIPATLFSANNVTALTADPTSPVEVRFFQNAEAFKIQGLELTHQQNYRFLPYPFKNLGSILSLTSIKTAGVARVYNNIVYELPIVPDTTVAATLYYEEGPFAFRTSYNKKSEYANFTNTALNPLGYQRWFNARAFLDASVSYKFNKFVEVRLDATNLTNTRTFEVLRHFEGRNGNEESRLEGANQAGRNYSLTLRGAF